MSTVALVLLLLVGRGQARLHVAANQWNVTV